MNYRLFIKKIIYHGLRKVYADEFKNYLYIVGAQKAGTSSLHHYLSQHPSIVSAKIKELHFFDKDKSYSKGFSYYRSFYPLFSSEKYALDATPSYLYNDFAPARIHAFKPEAKIIIILREPVSRACSAFNMYKESPGSIYHKKSLRDSSNNAKEFFMPLVEGIIEPEIDYFLTREKMIMSGKALGAEPALIRRGIYAPQLKKYLDLFGSENVMIIFSDELRQQTLQTVNRVFDFVGIDPQINIDIEPQHVREYAADSSVKDAIREYADELFERDKQVLVEKYHLNVPW